MSFASLQMLSDQTLVSGAYRLYAPLIRLRHLLPPQETAGGEGLSMKGVARLSREQFVSYEKRRQETATSPLPAPQHLPRGKGDSGEGEHDEQLVSGQRRPG